MGSLRAKRLRPLAGLAPDTLLVHEIYASVQGESTHVGQPCVFVRT
ncbi:MAG: 7-carboxy-7-deazaguanine synthase, partial [Myxococcota bacterium]